MAGLHLDVPARRAELRSIQPLREIATWWPAVWPGWELTLWGDDPGTQLARAPKLTLPPVDRDLALRLLAHRVDEHCPAGPEARPDSRYGYTWASSAPRPTPERKAAPVAAILDGRALYED
ncbi:MAG: hypothetical protein ABW022_23330 [Actinoplanes sp.]